MTNSRSSSNQEFFGALPGLIDELRAAHPAAVDGTTDGWALPLESIQKVESDHSSAFRQSQRNTLTTFVWPRSRLSIDAERRPTSC